MTEWAEPQIADVLNHYGHPCPDADGLRWKKFSCPFHEDTNPSASLSPDGIRMKCFSCEFSGTGVAVILELEGLTKDGAGWIAANQLSQGFIGDGDSNVRSERRGSGSILGGSRNQPRDRSFVPAWKRF